MTPKNEPGQVGTEPAGEPGTAGASDGNAKDPGGSDGAPGRPTVGLRFGPLAPPIVDQLSGQGVDVPAEAIAPFQTDADALTSLHLRGLLTDSAASAARRKLADRILSGL